MEVIVLLFATAYFNVVIESVAVTDYRTCVKNADSLKHQGFCYAFLEAVNFYKNGRSTFLKIGDAVKSCNPNGILALPLAVVQDYAKRFLGQIRSSATAYVGLRRRKDADEYFFVDNRNKKVRTPKEFFKWDESAKKHRKTRVTAFGWLTPAVWNTTGVQFALCQYAERGHYYKIIKSGQRIEYPVMANVSAVGSGYCAGECYDSWACNAFSYSDRHKVCLLHIVGPGVEKVRDKEDNDYKIWEG